MPTLLLGRQALENVRAVMSNLLKTQSRLETTVSKLQGLDECDDAKT
jgi:hypothetical protein